MRIQIWYYTAHQTFDYTHRHLIHTETKILIKYRTSLNTIQRIKTQKSKNTRL